MPDRANSAPASYSDGAGSRSFNWQVQLYNSNLTFSPVYFLWLNPRTSQEIPGHYFNITNQAQSSFSSSPSPASTSSIPSSTSMIATPAASTLPQTTLDIALASPSSAGSLSETSKVGLGVGLGIGVPLVLILELWIRAV